MFSNRIGMENSNACSFPVQMLMEGVEIDAIQKSYVSTWEKKALLYRQGGSVPIIGIIHRELGIPITCLGFGVGGNGHAPNEYIMLEHFYRGIETAINFFYNLAKSS